MTEQEYIIFLKYVAAFVLSLTVLYGTFWIGLVGLPKLLDLVYGVLEFICETLKNNKNDSR